MHSNIDIAFGEDNTYRDAGNVGRTDSEHVSVSLLGDFDAGVDAGRGGGGGDGRSNGTNAAFNLRAMLSLVEQQGSDDVE